MSVCVVLLRGINVGSHNRISMGSLRAVLEQVGCRQVRTYVQSGNAVVSWDGAPADLEQRARAALEAGLLTTAPVMVRTAAELDEVVAQNPWPDEELDPKRLHAAFLAGAVDPARAASVDHAALAPERLAVGPRLAYLYYANGVQRSRLGKIDVGGGAATARNWSTVLALQRMASDLR